MRTKSRWRHRGYMLIEIVMAGLLIGLAMVMTVALLSGVAHQRRVAERRSWALQEAANVMERINAMSYEKLSDDAVKAHAQLSKFAADFLPEGRVEAKVREEQSRLPMKRIDVLVSWRGSSGQLERPVRLTSWKAPKESTR